MAEYLRLTAENLAQQHICCALSGKTDGEGVLAKKEWLRARFADGLVFLKLNARGKVFIEYLPAEAYIDCLYVHPTHQGQGVGSALLSHVLSLAQTQAPTPLCADAAITALPLFLRHGFTLLHENRIRRHGEILVNYRVQKAWRPAKPS